MTITALDTGQDAAQAMRPILVVDDSRAQRRLLVRTLSNWGYDTVEAEGGEAALAICEAQKIDVIISDWKMPGMSGVEFCKAFRAMSDRPAYFILLTAQTEREVLAEGLESGADDFLSKPFHPVELRARLRAGARMVQAQRALAEKLDELSNAYAAIDRDLRGARAFQEGLVPERHIVFPGAQVSLLFRSSGHVGGDLVGHFRINAQEIAVFSVDVSGHGVASALMTARIAGYLSDAAPDRNIALHKVADGYVLLPLNTVLRRLNQILQSDAESDQYLTMSIAQVDLTTGRVQICQAGHPSPAIQRRGGGVAFLDMWSTPLGLIDEAEFAVSEMTLAPGDRLILYSDGLTECPGPGGAMLDEDGLERILLTHAARTGQGLIEAVLDELERFAGRSDFPDDVSAVVLHRI